MNKIILKSKDINALHEYGKNNSIDYSVCPFKDIEIYMSRAENFEVKTISMKCYRKENYVNIYLAIDSYSFGRFRVSNVDGKLLQNKTEYAVKDDELTVFYTTYFLLMNYVANYRPEKVLEVKESKVSVSNHKNSKKKVTNTTYLFSSSFSPCRGGHHASPSYSFSVRGHYRHLKNGKVIWIKEHIKGNGKKKGHEYRI